MITLYNKASSLSKSMKPRVNSYQLTTQYNPTAPDGVNTMLGEYSIVFEDTQDNIEALDVVLSSLNGTTQFEWNPYSSLIPTSPMKQFICDEWDTSYDTAGKSTLTATFLEQPII